MSVLGIDLGTTSIKISIYELQLQCMVATFSQVTNAYFDSEFREQDVNLIWSSLLALLTSVDADILRNVKRIAVSGQMHGVVLWRKLDPDSTTVEESRLITWEDQRCDRPFLQSLPVSKYQNICTGYGCASLFWLQRHRAAFLDRWQHAGTIADLLVTRLCGLETCPMSPHCAASWGYFDMERGTWEEEILSGANFPVRLLPTVVPTGQLVGHVTEAWAPLPAGAAVFVALGDLQASVLAALRGCDEHTVVVNVGTSSQLAVPLSGPPPTCGLPPGVFLVPYFAPTSRLLAVAASLNGGNVLASLVSSLRTWCAELGLELPAAAGVVAKEGEDPLWSRLEAAAMATGDVASPARVRPLLFGERHRPYESASVTDLRPGPGLSIGALYKAVCLGLMENLKEMAGPELLGASVRRVIGTGSALRQNTVLCAAFRATFSEFAPEVLQGEIDASLGAALSVAVE